MLKSLFGWIIQSETNMAKSRDGNSDKLGI